MQTFKGKIRNSKNKNILKLHRSPTQLLYTSQVKFPFSVRLCQRKKLNSATYNTFRLITFSFLQEKPSQWNT